MTLIPFVVQQEGRTENAIVRQSDKLFELEFEAEALTAIAHKSLDRKLIARDLRTTIEDLMLSIIFRLPSPNEETRIVTTRRIVEENVLSFERFKKAVGA